MAAMASKLQSFNDSLNEAEKANFKLLLGLAAGGLAPQFSRPHGGMGRTAFDAVTETLAGLQPYRDRIPKNGIAYRGTPNFLSDSLLESLQNEAMELRPKALRFEEHFLGCGAPIANELAVSSLLLEFVTEYAGEVESTGIASYIFYDEAGQGIDPHIDTDIFSLNVLLMLRHVAKSDKRSCLVLFSPNTEPERLDLQEGELLLMFAGSVPHGREHIKQGESVTILTFGFKPVV